jgi:ketosteroid isomerase-like protein
MQKIKLLIVTLFLSAVGIAQTTAKEEQEVQQTIENMFATLTTADTVALKTFVTPTVRFYEYGQIWTIDTLIKKVMQSKSISDFKRTNKFEFINTTIRQNIAWVTYYLQSTITRNGKEEIINWQETVVLLKKSNVWKIDVLHSTRLPKN